MAVHAVDRTDGEPLEVPVALDRLPGVGLGEAAVLLGALGDAGQLGGGGDVADQQAAGHERVGDGLEALPGRKHVEDHAVDRAGRADLGQGLGQVADRHGPGRVVGAEEGAGVAAGDLGEVGPALEGQQPPLVADGAQQRHGQRPGPHAGLDHGGAGEDVGILHDLARVLGIDDGGAAGHGHDVVGQQRAQREELLAGRVGERGPVGQADDAVVQDAPAVGVELAADRQRDRVHAAARVGQLHPLAGLEGASASGRAGGLPWGEGRGGVGLCRHGPSTVVSRTDRPRPRPAGPGCRAGALGVGVRIGSDAQASGSGVRLGGSPRPRPRRRPAGRARRPAGAPGSRRPRAGPCARRRR